MPRKHNAATRSKRRRRPAPSQGQQNDGDPGMVIAGSRPAQATIAKRMMYPHGRASLSKSDAKVVESRLPQLQHAAKPHREIWDSRVNACKSSSSSSSSSSFEAVVLVLG
uniref:Uncharacterized protein n=1 Tax=Bigelowiella natans TaxID=227086 RepID=A0A7S2KKQ4_BIGNA|mmetsp:Transcript_304/g.422  ORF Transcript_304/g.422 Transcript_304/m.422 type:complete len:110 (+) Transcript_304:48-377(+)